MGSCPFESRFVFNDRMLQVYEPGETGITPHMDRTAYRNLICLFVLEGRGRFGICQDRSGRGTRIIAHEPGDVVLTRAPGVQGAPTIVRSISSIESPSGATCSGCGTNAALAGERRPLARWSPASAVDGRGAVLFHASGDRRRAGNSVVTYKHGRPVRQGDFALPGLWLQAPSRALICTA